MDVFIRKNNPSYKINTLFFYFFKFSLPAFFHLIQSMREIITTLDDLIKFREDLFSSFKNKKVDWYFFASRTYFFYKQNHIKIKKMAYEEEDILFNYFYWCGQIERNVGCEIKLSTMDLDNEDLLNNKINKFIKRRDFMVKRLLIEAKMLNKITNVFIVAPNIVEIHMKNYNFPIYCSADNFGKIKQIPLKIKKSNFFYYIPFIHYKKNN